MSERVLHSLHTPSQVVEYAYHGLAPEVAGLKVHINHEGPVRRLQEGHFFAGLDKHQLVALESRSTFLLRHEYH